MFAELRLELCSYDVFIFRPLSSLGSLTKFVFIKKAYVETLLVTRSPCLLLGKPLSIILRNGQILVKLKLSLVFMMFRSIERCFCDVKVSFLIKLQAEACNFIEKETLAKVFSCEFCYTFKNTFFI